jgi:hypothetical protein
MEHVGRYRKRATESRSDGPCGRVSSDAFTLRDILIRDLGVEKTDRIIFEAGKKAGQEYCDGAKLVQKPKTKGVTC